MAEGIAVVAASTDSQEKASETVNELGLRFPIGYGLPLKQTASMLGRVTLGWIADHVASSTMTLAIASLGSAVSTILLGFSTSTWPLGSFVVLAGFAGIAVSGWKAPDSPSAGPMIRVDQVAAW